MTIVLIEKARIYMSNLYYVRSERKYIGYLKTLFLFSTNPIIIWMTFGTKGSYGRKLCDLFCFNLPVITLCGTSTEVLGAYYHYVSGFLIQKTKRLSV